MASSPGVELAVDEEAEEVLRLNLITGGGEANNGGGAQIERIDGDLLDRVTLPAQLPMPVILAT